MHLSIGNCGHILLFEEIFMLIYACNTFYFRKPLSSVCHIITQLTLSLKVWIIHESSPDLCPRSYVCRFFFSQHSLIRGDPGAEHKRGFDKLFASIMGWLNIYTILCTTRHAYSSKTFHHAPFSHACTILNVTHWSGVNFNALFGAVETPELFYFNLSEFYSN